MIDMKMLTLLLMSRIPLPLLFEINRSLMMDYSTRKVVTIVGTIIGILLLLSIADWFLR